MSGPLRAGSPPSEPVPFPSPFLAPADRQRYTHHADHAKPFSLRILTGNSNPELAEDVAALVGYEMRRDANARLLTPKVFANGEIDVRFETCLRGDDVFLVQPTCPRGAQGVHSSIMELLLMVHTARLASAKRVTAVVPYMAYGRQSSMTAEGTPIAALAIAKLLLAMRVDQLVTVDLNASQTPGFFHNVPVTNLPATPLFRAHLQTRVWRRQLPPVDRLVMVALGPGNVARARELGDMLGVWKYVTILTRHRHPDAGPAPGAEDRPAKALQLDGAAQCPGMGCILVDDVVHTFGPLAAAVALLREAGAQSVVVCATHGLFTPEALDLVNGCEGLQEVVVTDTTPQAEHQRQCPKLTVLAASPLLSMAIRRIHGARAEKEDDWDTRQWNEYDFGLSLCPISSVELLPSPPPSPLDPL